MILIWADSSSTRTGISMESDEELEVFPRFSATLALEVLNTLRLHEEQQAGVSHGLIRALATCFGGYLIPFPQP
jgi:hypothetical protein